MALNFSSNRGRNLFYRTYPVDRLIDRLNIRAESIHFSVYYGQIYFLIQIRFGMPTILTDRDISFNYGS